MVRVSGRSIDWAPLRPHRDGLRAGLGVLRHIDAQLKAEHSRWSRHRRRDGWLTPRISAFQAIGRALTERAIARAPALRSGA